MRILYVLHSFPPHTKGGTELYASQLLLELARDHEVFVFYRTTDAFRPDYEVTSGKWRGIRTLSINYNYRDYRDFRNTYENSRMESLFAEVVRHFKPDIVHVHHLTGLSMGLPAAARQAGARAVVLTVHDLWLSCAQGQMMRRDLKRCEAVNPVTCAACQVKQLKGSFESRFWVKLLEHFLMPVILKRSARKVLDVFWGIHEKLIAWRSPPAVCQIVTRQQAVEQMLESVDQCLLPSRALYSQVVRAGFPEQKMLLAPKGIPPLSKIRPRQKDGVTRIGFLGTLIPSKGPQVLIQAMKKIRSPFIEVEFYGPFVPYDGFPAFEAWIRAEIDKDPRFRLAGTYRASDLPDILSRLDLVAIPSLWIENRPLVVEEALQAGLPVAASDLDSMREQVRHGENGLLFEPGNPDDLARVLEQFLKDPGLVRSPGRGGRAIKTVAEDAAFHASLYERLLHPLPFSSPDLHNA